MYFTILTSGTHSNVGTLKMLLPNMVTLMLLVVFWCVFCVMTRVPEALSLATCGLPSHIYSYIGSLTGQSHGVSILSGSEESQALGLTLSFLDGFF